MIISSSVVNLNKIFIWLSNHAYVGLNSKIICSWKNVRFFIAGAPFLTLIWIHAITNVGTYCVNK